MRTHGPLACALRTRVEPRSKLVADRSWRTEREKTTALERELAFYQAQSATAMVRAAWRPSAIPYPQTLSPNCQ